MNYVKMSIKLPGLKHKLSKQVKAILSSTRDELYKLGCFDINWLDASSDPRDMKDSDIVIDFSKNTSLRKSIKSDKTIYISASLTDINTKLLSIVKESILSIYKGNSKVASSGLPALYHISFNSKLPVVLKPRQPYGSEIENDEEVDSLTTEDLPPRVSFSSSIEGCFRAIYPNIINIANGAKGRGIKFSVYTLDKKTTSFKSMDPQELTEKRKIHDACFTSEYCFFKNVYIRKTADIEIFIPAVPSSDKIVYEMFGGPLKGENTGWVTSMRYKILKGYTATYKSISSLDDNFLKDI